MLTPFTHQADFPRVYGLVSAQGWGRAALLRHLFEDLLQDAAQGTAAAQLAVYCFPGEQQSLQAQIGSRALVAAWSEQGPFLPHPLPCATVVVLADGAAAPIDFLERFSLHLRAHQLPLARLWFLLDCVALQAHDGPDAWPWVDACVHFSDMVLLARSQRVPKRWVAELQGRYRKACMPCRWVALDSRGHTPNPEDVLYPEARRLSHAFDLDEDPYDDLGDELLDLQEPLDLTEAREPYFRRDDKGQRVQPVPFPGFLASSFAQ
jgi:hypothetical protein